MTPNMNMETLARYQYSNTNCQDNIVAERRSFDLVIEGISMATACADTRHMEVTINNNAVWDRNGGRVEVIVEENLTIVSGIPTQDENGGHHYCRTHTYVHADLAIGLSLYSNTNHGN